MNPSIDSPELRAISVLLGREICRPLDVLEASLNQLLTNPDHLPSTSERGYATTMLELCDDLRRLTEESLGTDDEASPAPPPTPDAASLPPRSA